MQMLVVELLIPFFTDPHPGPYFYALCYVTFVVPCIKGRVQLLAPGPLTLALVL